MNHIDRQAYASKLRRQVRDLRGIAKLRGAVGHYGRALHLLRDALCRETRAKRQERYLERHWTPGDYASATLQNHWSEHGQRMAAKLGKAVL